MWIVPVLMVGIVMKMYPLQLYPLRSEEQKPTKGFHVVHNQDLWRFLHSAFYSQIKSKIGNILSKDTSLRIKFNIDGDPITSPTHTHPPSHLTPLTNLSSLIHFLLLFEDRRTRTKWVFFGSLSLSHVFLLYIKRLVHWEGIRATHKLCGSPVGHKVTWW